MWKRIEKLCPSSENREAIRSIAGQQYFMEPDFLKMYELLDIAQKRVDRSGIEIESKLLISVCTSPYIMPSYDVVYKPIVI